jgi:thioredoxin 1
MRSRRWFLTLMGLAPAALAFPSKAFEIRPYDAAAAQKAIASGKPVVIHVHASWCLHCHAQASILDSLKSDSKYDGVTLFRVDYDNQKDVVAKLNCSRATLIAYKGGKEVKRMSWETTPDSVLNVLKAAM